MSDPIEDAVRRMLKKPGREDSQESQINGPPRPYPYRADAADWALFFAFAAGGVVVGSAIGLIGRDFDYWFAYFSVVTVFVALMGVAGVFYLYDQAHNRW